MRGIDMYHLYGSITVMALAIFLNGYYQKMLIKALQYIVDCDNKMLSYSCKINWKMTRNAICGKVFTFFQIPKMSKFRVDYSLPIIFSGVFACKKLNSTFHRLGQQNWFFAAQKSSVYSTSTFFSRNSFKTSPDTFIIWKIVCSQFWNSIQVVDFIKFSKF